MLEFLGIILIIYLLIGSGLYFGVSGPGHKYSETSEKVKVFFLTIFLWLPTFLIFIFKWRK